MQLKFSTFLLLTKCSKQIQSFSFCQGNPEWTRDEKTSKAVHCKNYKLKRFSGQPPFQCC